MEVDCLESRIPRHRFHEADIVRRDDRDYRQTQRERDWQACRSFQKRTLDFQPVIFETIRREDNHVDVVKIKITLQ